MKLKMLAGTYILNNVHIIKYYLVCIGTVCIHQLQLIRCLHGYETGEHNLFKDRLVSNVHIHNIMYSLHMNNVHTSVSDINSYKQAYQVILSPSQCNEQ